VKGKRERSKRWAEQDLALRTKCAGKHPAARGTGHEVGTVKHENVSKNRARPLDRFEGSCLFCGQTVIAYDNGAAQPRIYRAKRYVIEEVPW
jgi:hypothetical protein